MLCDSATNSLLSASQLTREKNAVVIITEKDAIGLEVDETVNFLLNATRNHAINENKILLTAKINNDNLYELCDLPSSHYYSPTNNSIFPLSPILSNFGSLTC